MAASLVDAVGFVFVGGEVVEGSFWDLFIVVGAGSLGLLSGDAPGALGVVSVLTAACSGGKVDVFVACPSVRVLATRSSPAEGDRGRLPGIRTTKPSKLLSRL